MGLREDLFRSTFTLADTINQSKSFCTHTCIFDWIINWVDWTRNTIAIFQKIVSMTLLTNTIKITESILAFTFRCFMRVNLIYSTQMNTLIAIPEFSASTAFTISSLITIKTCITLAMAIWTMNAIWRARFTIHTLSHLLIKVKSVFAFTLSFSIRNHARRTVANW